MFYLRPHHILCFRNFVGLGYDERFTKRVINVFGSLKENPSQSVFITLSSDALCGFCPNLTETGCSSFEKVKRLDLLTFSALGLSEKEYTWSEILELAEAILPNGSAERKEICGDCNWRFICK